MPIFAVIGWQLISGFWGATLLPLIKAIPWQVWLAVGLFLGVLYYGHYSKKVGYAQCEVVYKTAALNEQMRQRTVAEAQIKQAQDDAVRAAQRAENVQGELDNAVNEVRKLKEANKVCIPAANTKRFIDAGRLRK